MPFCRHCGKELSDDAAYCVTCGTAVKSQPQMTVITQSPYLVTGWAARFAAWLIDVIIVTVVLIPVKGLIGPWNLGLPGVISWVPFLNVGVDNVFYFLYWTFMEGIYCQSIGKMVMGIRVTPVSGRPMTLGTAAIESLGKAFLLPIDCLLGWILYPTKNQRLFNYLTDTTVVSS